MRDPLSSSRKRSQAENRAPNIRAVIDRHIAACDWLAMTRKMPLLTPYRDALLLAGDRGAKRRAAKALVEMYVRWAGLLPDDTVCHVLSRKMRAGRAKNYCYRGQVKGPTNKTLATLGKGWCVARKASQTSRNFGIETHKIASLFSAPELGTGFADKILDGFIDNFCPTTR